MKKNIKDSHGFGIVEIILGIAILGLIGFAGYSAYGQSHKASKQAPKTTQAPQASTTPEKSSKPETPKGSYELKDWGIKIALRDYEKVQFAIKNQSGEIFGTNHYEGYAELSFKPAFLQKECIVGVSLYRSKTKFASGRDDAQKKIGDYYYIVTGGPGSCGNDPEHNPDDQLKTRFLQDVSDPNNYSMIQ